MTPPKVGNPTFGGEGSKAVTAAPTVAVNAGKVGVTTGPATYVQPAGRSRSGNK